MNSKLTDNDESFDVSFVIPCLNEESSIGFVIQEIQNSTFSENYSYEIVVADNGSTDQSIEISKSKGARVINIPMKGYGAALRGGINNAKGRIIVMGDADGSYTFSESLPMVQMLENGYDLVLGNRFKGGIEKNAMPWLHKYLGNPVLSKLGRILFRIPARDFHCGLRAFKRSKIIELDLKTNGMEFASEMLVMAAKNHYEITEVPVTLKRDLRNRKPHLKTWRDGWRHLRFLLSYSPNWVFLPPLAFTVFAESTLIALGAFGPLRAGNVEFNYRTAIAISTMSLVSALILSNFMLARVLLDRNRKYIKHQTEFILVIGSVPFLLGVSGFINEYKAWAVSGFAVLPVNSNLLFVIAMGNLVCLGVIIMFFGLISALLRFQSQ